MFFSIFRIILSNQFFMGPPRSMSLIIIFLWTGG